MEVLVHLPYSACWGLLCTSSGHLAVGEKGLDGRTSTEVVPSHRGRDEVVPDGRGPQPDHKDGEVVLPQPSMHQNRPHASNSAACASGQRRRERW